MRPDGVGQRHRILIAFGCDLSDRFEWILIVLLGMICGKYFVYLTFIGSIFNDFYLF